MNHSTLFRRTMSMVLCIIMVLSLVAMPISADELEETLGEIASVSTLSEGEAAPLSDAEEETIYVIAASDYQTNGSPNESDAATLPNAITSAKIMHRLTNNSIDVYGALFCGDYTQYQSASDTKNGINQLKYYMQHNLGNVQHSVFVQGNHDRQATPGGLEGLSKGGANDTEHYGVWVLNNYDYGYLPDNEVDPNDSKSKYRGNLDRIQAECNEMRAYFQAKLDARDTKPIFVAAHIPLHYTYRTRTYEDGRYASYIVDVLNEFGGKGLNIIYLFGHNHSAHSDNYIGGGAAYLGRGDTIFVSQPSSVTAKPLKLTLNFTYMNAGYMGYISNDNPGGNVKSMALFEITGDTVRIKRYSTEGMTPVRAKGTLYSGKADSLESHSHYGLSETEMNTYMNQTFNTVTVLPVNDNGNMGVKVEQPKYKTAYYQAPRFIEDFTYVIANYGDAAKTGREILGTYTTAGNVRAQKVNVGANDRGYYIVLPSGSTATEWEWVWEGVSGGTALGTYGTLKSPASGKYLQITETAKNYFSLGNPYDGDTNGMGLTTTENRNTKAKMLWVFDQTKRTQNSTNNYEHAGKPYGLAYFADANSGSEPASSAYYLVTKEDNTGWSHRNYTDIKNRNECGPSYIYNKVNDHYDPSESSWIWAEGKSEYHLVTGQIGSWTKLKTLIQSELRVVKETNGEQTVISTYTLKGTADPTTIGTYTLYVDYNGQTLASITVYVADAAETFLPGESTVDPNFGSVFQGADVGTDTGAVLTLRFSNGAEIEVPVLVSMLQNADGTAVDTSKLGTYENLKVVYKEYTICEDFVLYVTDKNYPVYPNVGSVKVDKTATGIDFQNTGAAQVELSATGVPKIGGIDVIVMVDTSSSMGWDKDVEGVIKSRLHRTHDAVNKLIDTLKENVTAGNIADVKIAIADFNAYRKASSASDYNTNWGYYAMDGNCYDEHGLDSLPYPESTNQGYVHGTRTGTDDPLDMSAKAFVDVMQLNNNGLRWANDNTLPKQSGTNYDFALDAVYQLGYNIKQRNKENGLTDRELIVVFLSDGVPFQFNYFMANSTCDYWNHWVGGTLNDAALTAFTNNDGARQFKHFYNADGKHWMAEAIKGDPNKDYTVIRKSKYGLEGAFKSFKETAGDNQYSGTLPGLGATMYTIALAVGGDGVIGSNTATSLLQRIASDKNKALSAINQEELDAAFHSFVGDMVNAASDAYYLDTMGKDYDLYTSNAFKKSDKTTVAGKIPTIQAIEYGLENGSRTGKTNVFEEITFGTEALNAAEGTEVSVTIQYKEKLTDTAFKTSTIQSFKMGEVLQGYRVWYNTSKKYPQTITVNNTTVELPPETFYYYIGSLSQDKEYALSYPVYLTDALDDNKDNDAVPAGIYPTNKSATLHYINYLGNPCQKDTVSPKLPWETAQVSYCFYLVDENGNIIRNQETGALTTDFNNRVAITNPVVYDTVDLNTSGDLLSDVLSKDVLPAGYELFVPNGVGYGVEVNSGEGGGSWTITADDPKNTTYVTGIGGNAYSNASSSTNEYNYSNTTVWFAVVANIGCVPDTVVVDFGLPVTIDVMSNDLMIGTNGILKGVGKDAPAHMKPTDGSNQSLETGFSSTLVKGENGLKYGDAAVSNGEVVYTLKTMEMDAQETFYYGLQYTGSVGAKGYYYGQVNVIPATIIYYEDNFLEYNAFEMEDNDKVDDEVVWSTGWTIENEEMKASQSQDRPGEYSLPELDANNIYGYDPSYAVMKNYSMGSAPYATVTEDYYATAEFDFWGTGFDVLSVCDYSTGTVMVSVYDKAEYYAMEGNTADRTAALTPVAIQMVDTFYGYSYDEETKQWTPITDNEKVPAATYQIPIIKVENLTYGNYTAVITVSYLSIFDHYEEVNEDKENYRIFIDAIRIYDPANDGEGNKVVQDAYLADGEGWPTYYELRNRLIGADSFSALSGNTYSEGIVFIDGNGELNDANASGKDPTGKSPAISDYTNFGPNNEVYLAKNQGVSFELPTDSNIAGVHIALKKIYGTTTPAKVRIFGATDKYSTVEPLSVNTTTDLYYDISHLLGDTIVIYNDTDSVISITNIKITHTQAPAEGEDRAANRFKVSKQGTAKILAALESTLPEIQEPEVTPTAPATVVNKWNIVLGDDIGANFYVEAPKDNAAMAAVKVTVAGHTEIYDLYAMTPNADGLYKISVNVAAAQMTEDITLQMVVDGEAYTAVSYTVQDYAKTILAGEYSAATKNLVQHMLSYGAAAQSYFGVNKDNLANAGNEIAYTAQYPAEYPQLAVTGKVSGIRFYGASLVFESKVAVRYYFEAESVEGVAFSVNGVSYPAVEKNGKFYVEVPGIAPSAYADSVVLSVQKDGQQLQVSYSPLTYMVRMSQKGQPELQALMNAMYGYYEAAIAYEQQAD